MSDATAPVGIAQDGPGHLRIEWKDGPVSRYPVRTLRLACRCALCVEERTGRPILREEEVPEDVRPVRISPVGRYAIQISWTDGHDSGIYTFEHLRALAAQLEAGSS
jgi:ATP-binding protein involved in chromosome partitioning